MAPREKKRGMLTRISYFQYFATALRVQARRYLETSATRFTFAQWARSVLNMLRSVGSAETSSQKIVASDIDTGRIHADILSEIHADTYIPAAENARD